MSFSSFSSSHLSSFPTRCLILLSVSSTERAHQSWRTSRRGRLFCRFMLWMLTRAPMAGSHTASCTKTPLCLHSAYTPTPVLQHTQTHFHFCKNTYRRVLTLSSQWEVLCRLSSGSKVSLVVYKSIVYSVKMKD